MVGALADDSYGFHFLGGGTNTAVKANEFWAWAVRDGDVGTAPEPTTLALMFCAF